MIIRSKPEWLYRIESDNVFDLTLAYICMLAPMWFFSGFIGSLVTNIYFYITFVFAKFHWNEAYCNIKDEDHKNFARCRVNPLDGSIDVYVIGIDRVCKTWKLKEEGWGDKTNENNGIFVPAKEFQHNIDETKLVETFNIKRLALRTHLKDA